MFIKIPLGRLLQMGLTSWSISLPAHNNLQATEGLLADIL